MKNTGYIKLFLVVLIAMIIGVPSVVKAADIDFAFSAYTCQLLDDATTDEDKEMAAENCINDYLDGNLSSISSGSELAPGANILVVANYQYNTSNVASTYNMHVTYDKNNVSAWTADDSTFKTTQFYLNKSNPILGSTYRYWKETITPSDAAGRITTLLETTVTTSSGVKSFQESSGVLLYSFFTVKNDAVPGTDLTFQFLESGARPSKISTFDSQTITFSQTPFTLTVAGGSGQDLNKEVTLDEFTVKANNINYLKPLNFVAKDSRRTYNIVVPSSVSSIDIFAKTSFAEAQLTGLASSPTKGSATKSGYSLNYGNNTLNFMVHAQDQTVSVETYTLNIYRLSDDATLDSFTIKADDSEVGSLSGDVYSATVAYSITEVEISAGPTHENASIRDGYDFMELPNYVKTGNNGLNTKIITVEAENCRSEYAYLRTSEYGGVCTTKDYTAEVTRSAPSKIKTLSNLTVDGETISGFRSNKYTYNYGTIDDFGPNNIAVPAETSSVEIGATLTDSKGKIDSGLGTCSLSYGSNTCTVVVSPEDPDVATQSYKITIYRLSNNNKMVRPTITAYVGSNPDSSLGTLSTDPDEADTYIFEYDPTVTKITFSTTLSDVVSGVAKSSAVLSNVEDKENPVTLATSTSDGSLSYNELSPSYSSLEILVTAEDGSTRAYTLILRRRESSDTTLSDLVIKNDEGVAYTISPTFESSKRTGYTVYVPSDVTSAVVSATPTSEYARGVDVNGNSGFTYEGPNTITVTVNAEKANVSADYVVNVVRYKHTESELTGLSAKVGDNEKISFDGSLSYTVNVDYDVTSIDISASTNPDYLITVTGEGTKNLVTGRNEFTIHTQSQDTSNERGTSKDYTVVVNRKKNDDPSISGVRFVINSVNPPRTINGTCNNETLICTLEDEVPNDITVANGNIYVDFEEPPRVGVDAPRATYEVTRTDLKTTDDDGRVVTNKVPIIVQVEDPSVDSVEYTLEVVRTRSSKNKLNTVYLTPSPTGVEKNCSLGDLESCSIDVPVTTTSFTLRGLLQDEKSNVTFATDDASQSGNTFTMASSQSDITIIATVTPEIGTPVKTYTITVSRERSSNNFLAYINTDKSGTMRPIENDFNKEKIVYNISVPGSIDHINILTELDDPDKASVFEITGGVDTNDDPNVIEINKSLTYADQINGNNPLNTVTITVKAENGSKRTYTINIKRLHNTDGTLNMINIDGEKIEDFSSSQIIYNLDSVGYDKTSLNINAITTDDLAKVTSIKVNGKTESITPSNDVTKSVNLTTGANVIEIEVKSHDEATANNKKYTINISREFNTDREIKSFSVRWDNTDHPVTCEDFICTLDNNLEVPYSFTIANKSNVKLEFNNPALNESEKPSYEVVPTSLETTDIDFNQIVNDVKVTVYSEDDRENNNDGDIYNLKLKRTRNNVKNLTQVNVYLNEVMTNPKTCTFGSSVECTIADIPTDTITVSLVGILEDSNKSRIVFTRNVDEETLTGPTFDFPLVDENNEALNTITINATVTAEDGTTKDYEIVLTRTLSSDNKLSELVITDEDDNEYTLTPAFDYENNPTQQSFSLVVTDAIDNLNIYAKAHDDRTTLTLDDANLVDTNNSISIVELNKELLHDVTNQIVITSKAQNNDSIKYTINIVRKRGINTYLSSFSYNHGELSDAVSLNGLQAVTFSHDMDDVEYTTTDVDLTATLEDERGTIDFIKINGVLASVSSNTVDDVTTYSATVTLQTGANVIEVRTKAHDTTKGKTYTLTVNRAYNADTSIKNIIVKTSEGDIEATCSTNRDTNDRIECFLKDTNDPVVVPHDMDVANSSNIKVYVADPLLASDDHASYTVSSTTLYTTDSSFQTIINEVPFTVIAEDGTTNDEYVLYVKRTQNDVKKLNQVDIYVGLDNTAIDESSIENTCYFTGDSRLCNLTVPLNTTSFKLVGTLKDVEKSRVTYRSGANVGDTFIMPSSDTDSTKVITATVTAEDGTTSTYTINVTREKSNNAFLKSLSTNAKQSPSTNLVSVDGFSQSKYEYTVNVLGDQDKLIVSAETFDSKSKVKLETDSTGFDDLSNILYEEITLNEPGIDTVIKVVVIPENRKEQDNKTYTITVKRQNNQDPYLTMIYIDGKEINEFLPEGVTFDGVNKEVYELVELPNTSSSIAIKTAKSDTLYGTATINGTPEGTGVRVELQTKYYGQTYPVLEEDEYVNIIKVVGIAHNTSVTKEYTLKIKRSPSDSVALDKVEVMYPNPGSTIPVAHEAICDKLNFKCTITVPNSVDVANDENVVVTPAVGRLSTDARATVTQGSTNLSTEATTDHKFTLTSEDGLVSREYTIVFTREKCSDPTIKNLLVYDITGVNIIGTFVTQFDPDLPEAQQVYTVNVPVGTSEFKVIAVLRDDKVTLSGASKNVSDTNGDNTLIASTKTVNITSTSQDNSASISYQLNIVRQASSDYKLGSISIKDQNNTEYNNDQSFTPSIFDENGKQVIPNGTTEFYLTVSGDDVTSLKFDIKPNANLSTIAYGSGMGLTTPDENGIINVVSDKSYRVEAIVTSESQVQKPYYINITVTPKSDNSLKSLKVRYDTTPESTDDTELLVDGAVSPFDLGTVSNSTTKIYITPTVNNPTARVTGDIGEQSLTTNAAGNTFTVTVTAENGNVKEYSIVVKRAKSDTATLDGLSIRGLVINEIFDSNTFEYTAYLSDETKSSIEKSDVTFTKTDSNSSVTYERMDISTSGEHAYVLTVTAEDKEATNDYVVKFTKPKSKNDYLEKVELSTGTIEGGFNGRADVREYTINVPITATNIDITGIPEVSSSTVSGNGNYVVSEGKEITLSVQAEVGSAEQLPRVYTFTIRVAKSNIATLDNLEVAGHLFKEGIDGKFDKTSSLNKYTVADNLEKSVEKLKVKATPTNTGATIFYYKNQISDDNLVCSGVNLTECDIDLIETVGKGHILVKVLAADEIVNKTYYIDYEKVESSNNFLRSITTDLGTLSPGFSSAVDSYTIDLPASGNSPTINLTFTADDVESSIKHVESNTSSLSSLVVPINDVPDGGSKVVTVSVTAPDQGNPKTYTVTIRRAKYNGSNNNKLDKITLTGDGYSKEITVTGDTITYDIGTLDYNINELLVNVITNHGKATVQYAGPGESYHDDNTVAIPVANGKKSISIQVRAENGEYKDYTVSYTKNGDDNNFLTNITVSGRTLNTAFDKNLGAYSVKEHLSSSESSIVINATKESEKSIITINGESYESGTNKTIQNLGFGANAITITVTAETGSSKPYVVTVYRDSDQELITSDNYGHTISSGYVMTISPEKKASLIKEQFDNESTKLQIWKADNTSQIGDNDIVGTGMILKLFVNGVMTDSKVLVVLGDVSGDGYVDGIDVSKMINHFLRSDTNNSFKLTGAYALAGDVTLDNYTCEGDDVSKVINYYLRGTGINYK